MAEKGYKSNPTIVDPTDPIFRIPVLDKDDDRKEKPDCFSPQDRSENAVGTKDLRNKTDKSISDRPTTASAKKGLKDLASVVNQVGKTAVHLQNMYSMMSQVSSILSSMGSSGDDEDKPTPSSGKKKIIEDALTGALAILIKKWGYDAVIAAFDNALQNNGIQFIDEDYREIVKNALANAYKSAVEYGPDNVPVYTYSTVTTIGPVPSPLVSVVPDMYTQEYYIQKDDPYPGFIKWNSLDGESYVFTERKIGDVYYVSADEEIYSMAEEELAKGLDPYMEDANLTAKILNDLLLQQNINVENNTDEKTLGKGAGSGGANVQQLLQQLLGFLSTASNLQKSLQLPVSVLNKGSIQKTMQKYEKSTAKVKQMSKLLDKALVIPSVASQVTAGIAAVQSGNISQIASSATQVASAAGVKVPKVLG